MAFVVTSLSAYFLTSSVVRNNDFEHTILEYHAQQWLSTHSMDIHTIAMPAISR
jgi:hypothetical protein